MTTLHWFRVHSFTGVITGLMLFVICWSGTFAVLSNEIDWLVTPEARLDRGTERVSWGEIHDAAKAAYPDGAIGWLEASRYSRSAVQVIVDTPRQSSRWVYVDPYTGEVRGSYSYLNVQRFFRSFHYSLFLPQAGLYLVSLFSLTMLASLVAALVFYKRWWRRFLQLPRGGGRAFWSGTHKFAGLWAIWFLLVIGLTGVWYLFEAARMDFGDGKFAYAGDGAYAVHGVDAPATDPSLPPLPLDALVAVVQQVRPDLDIRNIWFDGGKVVFEGQAGHWLVRDRANRIWLDARTGEVLYDQNASDYPLYWRWSDTADPLHFGDFGGLWSKAVWFLFGLILCGLILTGTYLHAQRLARDAGGLARHRWPGTGAAIVVSLLVLAASVPYGFWEAREYYGPAVDGVKQLPTLAPGVKVVIIGWVVLTLAIVAGWTWLLWRPRVSAASVSHRERRPDAIRP